MEYAHTLCKRLIQRKGALYFFFPLSGAFMLWSLRKPVDLRARVLTGERLEKAIGHPSGLFICVGSFIPIYGNRTL